MEASLFSCVRGGDGDRIRVCQAIAAPHLRVVALGGVGMRHAFSRPLAVRQHDALAAPAGELMPQPLLAWAADVRHPLKDYCKSC